MPVEESFISYSSNHTNKLFYAQLLNFSLEFVIIY